MEYPIIKIQEALDIYKENTGNVMRKKELASKIDFNTSSVTIENYLQRSMTGDKDLPCSILKQVSEILGVSTDFLLGLSKDESTIEISSKRLSKKIDLLKKEKDEMFKSFF